MKHYDEKQMQENILYLEALSEQYPNIQSAAAEMINLHAILDLPKGTEHFLSDIHGEHEAFRHILNNASGSIREKIDDLFSNTLTSEQRAEQEMEFVEKNRLSCLTLKDEAYPSRLRIACRMRRCTGFSPSST